MGATEGQLRGVQAPLYLHLAKWLLALRQTLGLAGHFTNLPLASLHGAANDGAELASRLIAVIAKMSFFILSSSLGTGRLVGSRSKPLRQFARQFAPSDGPPSRGRQTS